MEIVQGVVEFISSKPAGRGTAYNVKMDNGTWYGHGFNKPSFEKGDNIKFIWKANGNFKNIETDSVEVLAAAPAEQKAASPSKSGTDWDAKDKRIAYMSARNTAIAAVKAAIELGIFKLPTGKGDKYAAFIAAIEEQAQEYFHSLYEEATFECNYVEETTTLTAVGEE